MFRGWLTTTTTHVLACDVVGAVAFFVVAVAAVTSTSDGRRRLLFRALLAALVSKPLCSQVLGLDLLYKPAEIRFQEALVRVPKLQCAALCLRSQTN